jgi:hypothetical protein
MWLHESRCQLRARPVVPTGTWALLVPESSVHQFRSQAKQLRKCGCLLTCQSAEYVPLPVWDGWMRSNTSDGYLPASWISLRVGACLPHLSPTVL